MVLTARLVAALLVLPLRGMHPMHTSITQLTHEPATRTLAVTVRVFADDFAAAAGAGDSATAAYLLPRLVLVDRSGRGVPLQFQRSEPAGDALLIHLGGEMPAGLAGARLRHSLLCDRFADQVNIVRATYEGRTTSLLFTASSGAKALP